MAVVGSGGNRRRIQTSQKHRGIVLATSVLVCLIGIASLFASIGDARLEERSAAAPAHRNTTSDEAAADDEPAFGVISALLPEEQEAPSGTSDEVPATGPADESAAPGQPATPPSQQSASPPSSPSPASSSGAGASREATGQPAARKHTKLVHHTAVQREPVYKTVYHPASTATTVRHGSSITRVLSKCPVCSKYHDTSFTERVVDYYRETGCAVCGEKHESAYDEIVSD